MKTNATICVLGIILVSAILFLIECYIMSIVFVLFSLLILAAFLYDDTPHSKTQTRNNSHFRNTSKWNGFSDPNDFPTDGCGNNGW